MDRDKLLSLADELRANADALKVYLDSYDEEKMRAHNGAFGRPYSVEERATDALVKRVAVSVHSGLNAIQAALRARAESGEEKMG